MRILFVAMQGSVHTARWISQLQGQDWDLHLFPAMQGPSHPVLRRLAGLTIHDGLGTREEAFWQRMADVRWPVNRRGMHGLRNLWLRMLPERRLRAARLRRVIRRLRPDVVHSMEIQHAGYLALDARRESGGAFPPWMVSNWGSDIVLFGRLAAHRDRVVEVMKASDYYTAECQRDVMLAHLFGFKGTVLPVVPISGGFDVHRLQSLCRPGRVSGRRTIAIKGYQHWAGRGLVALQALRYCAGVLRDYTVKVYLAGSEDMRIAAELVAQETGLRIELTPFLSHDDVLRLHGESRVSVALSISDGISHSLMEAMIMGSFPIQSCTACVGEWGRDGETGLFVEPEDPRAVAEAITRAVTDDALVDCAGAVNMRTTRERLDCAVVCPKVIGMYESVAKDVQRRKTGI